VTARVTVVMITHNRRFEVLRTLDRMAALTDRAPIIVVDNGSTDGTADAIARAHPEPVLVRSPDNLGAVARNIAVRQVRTPYVAFCDDDTTWESGSLTRAADLLDSCPQLASVTGRCLVEPSLREDPIMPELRHSPVPAPSWLPGPALLGILAGLTMLRVEAFWDVGGFSSRMWLGGEEELLAIDLAARGWWMVWAEDVVIHHAPSVARDARRRRQLGIRNTLWTAWLRRPPSSAARHTAWVLSRAPKDLATMSALAEAVRGLPWVLNERRVVPEGVEHGLRLLEQARKGTTARSYVG
jgi:glycosyltransferase involved in cell wall biosynthesis